MAFRDDRQQQLLRLLQMLDHLERGDRLTRVSLAEQCGCSRRTIARDLEFLKGMGVEVRYDARAGSYRLDSPIPFKTVQFTLREVLALAIARESLQAQSGSPFHAGIQTAFHRVLSQLPEDLRSAVAETQSLVSFGTDMQRDYAQAPWQELTQATHSRQTVEICYHTLSRDELKFRRVDPYLLAERNGYLMLVAFCHARHEIREFALDRIRQLRGTDATFTIAPDFCRDEYFRGAINALRGAPTKILVRFDPALSPYAEKRQWQFPHEFEAQPDGSLLLKGTVSGELGIRNELLSWGAGVEVLEPATLREAMRAAGQAMAEKHGPKKS